MASHTFSQKKFIPTPPEKGSFPLDHENICKESFFNYMSCLRVNDDTSSNCRDEARDYITCRMDNSLMEKTPLSKLGLEDKTKTQKPADKQ